MFLGRLYEEMKREIALCFVLSLSATKQYSIKLSSYVQQLLLEKTSVLISSFLK